MSNGIEVTPSRLDASPGVPARVALTIRNDESEPAAHQVRVIGAESAWAGDATTTAVVEPGATTTIELEIRLPLGFPSGEHLLGVEVIPLGPDGGALHARRRISDLVVAVGTLHGLHGVIEPQNITAGWRARTVLSLRNRSDAPLQVTLDDDSPGGAVRVTRDRDEVVIGPGHVVPVRAKLRGPTLLWGRPRRIPFTITASSGSQQVHLDGTFQQRALLGAGVMKGLAILAVFAVWASTLSYVFDRIADDGTPPTETATEAGAGADGSGASAGGDDPTGGTATPGAMAGGRIGAREPGGVEVRLRAVSLVDEVSPGGSAGGLSSAAPGVKLFGGRGGVIQNRILPEERTTISDPDGRWAFTDITGPGFYELRFSKGGYQTVSYVVEAPEDGAPIALDVDMVAGDGAMSGRITDTGGRALGDVEVTVTDGVVTISTRTATTGDVGSWTVEGLATPGSYLVTAAHRNYGTGTALVRLSGGQERTGVDLALEAGVGTVLGTVRSPAGPLGGVTVTATDGDLARTTSTLTEGPIGTFSLPQLPIPGTYTLTVEGEGWVTQTREVHVDSGEARVDFDLVASTGIVYGRLIDGTDGTGVGGAGITATSDTGTFKSTTSPDGTYELAGLPAGTYVIEFERFEYETGSALVTIGPGGLREVDVTLTRRTQLSPDPDNTLSVNVSAPGVSPTDIYVTVTDRESGISSFVTGGSLIILEDVPAGVRTLDIARSPGAPAEAAGLQPTTATVQMPLRGSVNISVAMKPLVVIDLSVRDVTGGSLDGADVVITRQACTGPECEVYTGTTDANGIAAPAPELSDGVYSVEVSLDGYLTRSQTFTANYDVRATEVVTVQLDRLARLSVDVVEPQGGGFVALTDVEVTLSPSSVGCSSGPVSETTDAHPHVIDGLPSCTWTVTLARPGYRTRNVGTVTTQLNVLTPVSAVLAPQPNGTTGTVVWTPDGEPDRPVAGASVTIVGVESYNRDGNALTAVTRTWVTQTDENGQYEIAADEGPLEDQATIAIAHGDFEPLDFSDLGGVDHGTRTLVPRPGSISGLVQVVLGPDTSPGDVNLAATQVTLVSSPGGVLDGQGPSSMSIIPPSVTFSFATAPAGPYVLRVSHADGTFTPVDVPLFVEPNNATSAGTIDLVERGRIQVSVQEILGPSTVPLPGATVGLRTADGDPISGIADVVLADTAVTHTFTNLDPGSYQIVAERDGYALVDPALVTVGVGESASTPVLLRKLVWVSGQLLGDRGGSTTIPLGGVTVTITQGTVEHHGTTDPDGRFAIRTVEAGIAVLTADVPDYEPVVITFDGAGANPLPFVAREDRDLGAIVTDVLRGSVEGVVVSTAGVDAPPAGLAVTLRSGNTPIAGSVDTDTGEFSYTDLLPGAYTLTIEAPNHLTQVIPLNIQAGGDEDLDEINLVFALNAVNGEVLLRVGSTLLPLADMAGTNVALLDGDGDVVDSQTTGSGGSYSFNDLEDGTYRIRAGRAGYADALSASFTLDEGQVRTVPQMTLDATNRTIAVTVRSAVGSTPVVGATVTLTPTEFSTGVAPPSGMQTAGGGVATFTNVVPGQYTATVSGAAVGHVDGSATIDLAVAANPTTGFAVTLQEVRITGWIEIDDAAVTNADGATITVRNSSGSTVASTTISGASGATASFTLFAPTTASSVLLGFPSLLSEERTGVNGTAGTTTTFGTEAVPIVLRRTATITFTLVETGTTTAITGDATITTGEDDDEITATGSSPVILPGVAAGSHTFTIEAAGYRTTTTTLTADRTTMAHTVELQPIGDATITISGGTGAPTVTLSRSGYTDVVQTGTGGQASFTFEDLDTGTWGVSVNRSNVIRTGTVTVTRGGTGTATITFP